MDPIRAVIVDDEPLARDGIRVLLDDDPEVEVVASCGGGREAVATVREAAPDLLFLDVQMPEMNGLEVLAALDPDEVPFVIFVTAYDHYAIQAFQVHALDYLLKPFDDERFQDALDRAKTALRRRRVADFADRVSALLEGRSPAGASPSRPGGAGPAREDDAPAGPGGKARRVERLVVKRSGRVLFVDVDDIDWIEAADYYVRLHVGDRSHLLRTTMKEMEASLDPDEFFRIHRSSIVRLDRIRELQPSERGEYMVVLDDGTRLALSRSRRKLLEEKLGQRL